MDLPLPQGECLKRALVPAVPVLVSLALSLSTIGKQVYWQDSGLFLAAVKDLGILYPPGFVLYVVLCKVWTLLFFFLDFTLAAHLFSAACTAAAAGLLALAVRDLLLSRGSLFRVVAVPDPALAGWAGLAAGAMAAGGYTFWFAGLYAKGYALYYLVLAALLWRMIRADDSGKSHDFTIVAVLIGLAWAAHPSSVCLAPALILFVVHHRATLGGREIARRVGIAAAVALAPSLLILPLLTLREPATALGDPRSLTELLDYAFGLRFMGRRGAFGVEPERIASFGVFLWEDFLAVGLSLLTLGLASLAGANRRLLLGILIWLLPYAATAILFKVEGQHDCWLVAAWLPLQLMVGLGLYTVAAQLPAPVRSAATGAAAVLSLVLAVRANHRDLDFRTYDFATIYGRVHLQNLDPGAILVLNSDDALSICGYLQRVKEERTDVTLVTQSFLGLSFVGDRDWYDARLLKSHPFLKPPDYAAARNRLTGVRPLAAHLAAFLEANAGSGHPIFTQTKLPPSLLPRGTVQVPAGVLWKLAPLGQDKVDFRYWSFAMNPEDVQGRVRRERGLKLTRDAEGLHSQAEAYETRLLNLLLKGQYALADVCLDTGRPVEAVRLLEAVRAMDSDYDAHPAFLYSLARAYQAAGDASRAEAGYQRALSIGLGPPQRGWAFCFLGELCAKKGRQEQAEICYTQASRVAGEDAPLRARLDKNTPPKPK
jgi:tetratricopeptide (TPR) repeat protein